MHRRAFLRALGLGAGAAALAALAPDLDVEKLLWKPGAKKVFLPPPPTALTDKELGLFMRYTKQYDLKTDRPVQRLDVLYGIAVMRPDFQVRVLS